MGGIFVSYRRKDSEDIVGRICERLRATFGSANVFQDTRTIPYGANFREEIAKYLGNSSAALIIIGPSWLTASEGRQQRLFQPNDVVRVEVETALATPHLTVIPVIVGGAHIPAKKELPASVAALTDRSATTIHGDPDFDHDMSDLIDALAKVIPVTGNTGVTRVREFEDRERAFRNREEVVG